MIWIIPLAILAIVANATMDEIRFHWDRIFDYWIPDHTAMYRWMCPHWSWRNKYVFRDNKFLTFILSSPLVFITDFWHFLKFIMLNSIYGIIILLIEVDMHWAWLILGFNLAWGVFYEFTSGVYGVFADKKKLD